MPAALRDGEFSVFYQPLVSSAGALHGCEALLRWRRPDGTVVPPADFIPAAENSGFILELGDYVLREALTQLSRFDSAGLVQMDMSVNVSAHQLAQPDFERKVMCALEDARVRPQRLVLEITESVTAIDEHHVTALLSRMVVKGVRVALDDYGTGYSNPVHLKNYPVSALKIDRAFVQGVADEEVSYVIVRSIINMAKALHLETFAEGVETALQAQALCDLGVDYLQGYLYGRPMPAADLVIRFGPQPAIPAF
ncbi:hypothetical protein WL29_20425 [Burkholderia ubonensis]|uniref:EAL domain-containing protein n=1 Tax=Burkholderia ubonensis TaxID=101571 RepID=A0A106QB33_9BURK|nr:EAL domain-containing protein [Burkholderia ubonensis]KWA83734.1 hypothetical protein WL29_20425 [Burkholderia ubonensis]